MTDSGKNVFQSALSDFAFEAACGGAVRHLADSGCTARQIMERLDYPVSGGRVQKALYKYLCDTGVILEKSPEEGLPETKSEYILEYNSYGKPSYRRKSAVGTGGSMSGSGSAEAAWKEFVYRPAAGSSEQAAAGELGRERRYFGHYRRKKVFGRSDQSGSGNAAGSPGRGAELSAFLTGYCSRNREESAYISCDFGIPESVTAKGIPLLNGRQQEYLEGILWPRHRVYHQLDHRMLEILCSLYEQQAYDGICCFVSRKEKLIITGNV